jgi:hypothetical protein
VFDRNRNREFDDLTVGILSWQRTLYHLKWMPDLVVRLAANHFCVFLEEYKSARSPQNDRCACAVL